MEFVTLVAGKGESSEEFGVHKEFACHYSPVLRAAFKSSFVVGRTQTYRFEEVAIDIVRLLVNWIYTQELHTAHDAEWGEEACLEDEYLAQLWVLADKLLIPSLQNMVKDKIQHRRNKSRSVAIWTLDYVWANTSGNSPLRRLMRDQCFRFVGGTCVKKTPQAFPMNFW